MTVYDQYLIPKEKVQQLEELLKHSKIDALLLITREGSDEFFKFLTGEDSIHVCAAIFQANGEHTIISSVNDHERYKMSGIFKKNMTYEQGLFESLKQFLLAENLNTVALNYSEIDANADGLSYGLYLSLEEALGKEWILHQTVSAESIYRELHSVKSKTEINYLQKAIDITTEIYDEVFNEISIGMTEIEVGELFVEKMKKYGVVNGLGEPYSFPIICIVRAGLAHRSPGHYRLQEGDILICDFSVNYKGYISDIARTGYCLRADEKKAPDDVQRAFTAAHEAITATIDYIGVGKKGYEVDKVGRTVIEEHGYPTVRHCVGHPIGTLCHDSGTTLGPPSREGTERPIEANEVYAIEPTVIQDDKLPCMLVEENVLIHENSVEILSKRQNELYLIGK